MGLLCMGSSPSLCDSQDQHNPRTQDAGPILHGKPDDNYGHSVHQSGFGQHSRVKTANLEPFLAGVMKTVFMAEADIPAVVHKVMASIKSSNATKVAHKVVAPQSESHQHVLVAYNLVVTATSEHDMWDVCMQHETDWAALSQSSPETSTMMTRVSIDKPALRQPIVTTTWQPANGSNMFAPTVQSMFGPASQTTASGQPAICQPVHSAGSGQSTIIRPCNMLVPSIQSTTSGPVMAQWKTGPAMAVLAQH